MFATLNLNLPVVAMDRLARSEIPYRFPRSPTGKARLVVDLMPEVSYLVGVARKHPVRVATVPDRETREKNCHHGTNVRPTPELAAAE